MEPHVYRGCVTSWCEIGTHQQAGIEGGPSHQVFLIGSEIVGPLRKVTIRYHTSGQDDSLYLV